MQNMVARNVWWSKAEGDRDRERKGTRDKTRAAPGHLLLPLRPHLLKVPPPRSSATLGAKPFTTWTFKRHSRSKL
jgi:hypothetical protein